MSTQNRGLLDRTWNAVTLSQLSAHSSRASSAPSLVSSTARSLVASGSTCCGGKAMLHDEPIPQHCQVAHRDL